MHPHTPTSTHKCERIDGNTTNTVCPFPDVNCLYGQLAGVGGLTTEAASVGGAVPLLEELDDEDEDALPPLDVLLLLLLH